MRRCLIAELQEASFCGGQLGHVVFKRLVRVGDRNGLLGGAQDIDEVGDLVVVPAAPVSARIVTACERKRSCPSRSASGTATVIKWFWSQCNQKWPAPSPVLSPIRR